MKKVMVFGTFDILHPGHISFLKQAWKFGDFLIVVVARDKTVEEVKKQKPANSEKNRLAKMRESELADKVILGGLGDKYAVIKKYKPDIVALGYDQQYFIEGLTQKLNKFGLAKTKIVRLKPHRPAIYKSSKLKLVKKIKGGGKC